MAAAHAGSGNESVASKDRARLPLEFLEWQANTRIELLRSVRMTSPSGVKHMPAHLPVMATVDEDGEVNLASKGVGLLPRPELLERYTVLFESMVDGEAEGPHAESAERRLEALLQLYGRTDQLDDRLLGGLEIFEGTTYRNLRRDPKAVLLFTGGAPDFASYEVRGEVRIVGADDAHYRYLLAARQLFARDPFHVLQSNYPHGFIVTVRSVKSKQPFSRS